MAWKDKKIYHSRRPWKTVLIVFIVLIVLLVVLAISVFFGFRKYIVYTDDGIVLEIPWLEEPTVTSGQEVPNLRYIGEYQVGLH